MRFAEEAVRQLPDRPDVAADRVLALHAAGRQDKARAALKALHKAFGDHPVVQVATRRIGG